MIMLLGCCLPLARLHWKRNGKESEYHCRNDQPMREEYENIGREHPNVVNNMEVVGMSVIKVVELYWRPSSVHR